MPPFDRCNPPCAAAHEREFHLMYIGIGTVVTILLIILLIMLLT